MIFTSFSFIFAFLPVTLAVWYLAKRFGNVKAQDAVLLTASWVFYLWCGVEYAVMMLVGIILNYGFGLLIDSNNGQKQKKAWCILAVTANVGVLAVMKYCGFFLANMQGLLQMWVPGAVLPSINIPLPVGISYYTFQILTYILDLYWGKVAVQKNLLDLSLYIMLFPKVVAGPITPYRDVIGEIKERTVDTEAMCHGAMRFMLGFWKKVLLANSMGNAADVFFNAAALNNSVYAWIGAILYALQIFMDSSSYADMAIGLGEIFGFHFMENFNYPYTARTIQDFWRRWHISLSSWFRDYVYIPLGGSRQGTLKTYRNLIVVFLLTGMWHGASWNFILWGLWYGVFLILERLGLKDILKKLPKFVGSIYTMAIVLIGWVLFRTETLAQAGSYLATMFGFQFGNWKNLNVLLLINRKNICWLVIALLFCFPMEKFWNRVDSKNRIRPLVIFAMFALSLCMLMVSDFSPFIYFRF